MSVARECPALTVQAVTPAEAQALSDLATFVGGLHTGGPILDHHNVWCLPERLHDLAWEIVGARYATVSNCNANRVIREAADALLAADALDAAAVVTRWATPE